jgi:uncharacterized protein YjbI with pentapeptide repeats
MAFDQVNDRLSARSRYLTGRPFSDGAGFTQAERQMLRWQYAGLLVGAAVVPEFVRLIGFILTGDNLTGTVLAGDNLTGTVLAGDNLTGEVL